MLPTPTPTPTLTPIPGASFWGSLNWDAVNGTVGTLALVVSVLTAIGTSAGWWSSVREGKRTAIAAAQEAREAQARRVMIWTDWIRDPFPDAQDPEAVGWPFVVTVRNGSDLPILDVYADVEVGVQWFGGAKYVRGVLRPGEEFSFHVEISDMPHQVDRESLRYFVNFSDAAGRRWTAFTGSRSLDRELVDRERVPYSAE